MEEALASSVAGPLPERQRGPPSGPCGRRNIRPPPKPLSHEFASVEAGGTCRSGALGKEFKPFRPSEARDTAAAAAKFFSVSAPALKFRSVSGLPLALHAIANAACSRGLEPSKP